MNIETKTKRKFVWIVGLACLFGVLAATSAQAQVKVGTNPATIDARSILELESDNQALYLPRLSDINLAAVSNWQEGMVVYNTDHDCIQIFNGTIWNCVDTDNDGIYDGSGTIPATTIATITDNLDFVTSAIDGFGVDGTTFSVDGANNRVGIGTTSPSAKLHIRNVSTSSEIMLHNGTAFNSGIAGEVIFKMGNESTNSGSIRVNRFGNSPSNDLRGGEMSFWTKNDLTNTSSRRMIIKNDGRIGINTYSPSATLDVNGSVAHNITTSTTIGADAHFVIIPGGAVTLPTPSSNTGRVLHFINTHASNAITFTTAPTGSITQVNAGMSASAICDGTTWFWYSIN